MKIERNSKQLDLSHILAPIIPHSESVSPTTVGNLNPYFDIFDSYYKGHDDKQGYTFNMPGLDNFKEFISYNGKFYPTDLITKLILKHNNNLIVPKSYEMLTKKIDLVRNEGYSLYSTALVPDINDNLIEYLSLLKQKIYSMTLEYNTLMKSKKYYLEVNSNNKYDFTNKQSFEVWQKRHISASILRFLPILFYNKEVESYLRNFISDHRLYEQLVTNLNRGTDIYIFNLISDDMMYDELISDLHYVQLWLIYHINLNNKLAACKFNFFNMSETDKSRFFSIVNELWFEHFNQYRDEYFGHQLWWLDNYNKYTESTLHLMHSMLYPPSKLPAISI